MHEKFNNKNNNKLLILYIHELVQIQSEVAQI